MCCIISYCQQRCADKLLSEMLKVHSGVTDVCYSVQLLLYMQVEKSCQYVGVGEPGYHLAAPGSSPQEAKIMPVVVGTLNGVDMYSAGIQRELTCTHFFTDLKAVSLTLGICAISQQVDTHQLQVQQQLFNLSHQVTLLSIDSVISMHAINELSCDLQVASSCSICTPCSF